MNLKKSLIAVAMTALTAVTLTACSGVGGSYDKSNPHETVTAYMEAVQSLDSDKVNEFLTPEATSEHNWAGEDITKGATPIDNITVSEVTVPEGATSLKIPVTFTVGEEEISEKIELVRDENNGWLITDPLTVAGGQTNNGRVPTVNNIVNTEHDLLPASYTWTWEANDFFDEQTLNFYRLNEPKLSEAGKKKATELALQKIDAYLQEKPQYCLEDSYMTKGEWDCRDAFPQAPTACEVTATEGISVICPTTMTQSEGRFDEAKWTTVEEVFDAYITFLDSDTYEISLSTPNLPLYY